MKIFAYCTQAAEEAVAQALGVKPLTSPPWTTGTFMPSWLEGHDLVYFRLHGTPTLPHMWLGESVNGIRFPALSLDLVQQAKLGGAVVVVANCYGADSPMVQALYQAGAKAVVAGSGPNLAAGNQVVGTDLLVSWIVKLMDVFSLPMALRFARTRLALTAWRPADRDTLEFHIVEKA